MKLNTGDGVNTLKQIVKRLLCIGLPVPVFLKPVIRMIYYAGVFLVESCTFLRKFFWVEPIVRSLCTSVGRNLRIESLPFIRGRGKIVIGDNVHLSGTIIFHFSASLPEKPEIIIGNNVFIGNRCSFSCARRISIDENALISAGVRIRDNDDHPLDPSRRKERAPVMAGEVADVKIGRNAWIGAGATILKGVSVGENSVVGTSAVVTSDVSANTVVAGNPAKTVRIIGTETELSR
ncbi:MAG: acyltransferase [Lentisphaerae bacterium]|nr:acyltransferase [Lentisphaerota bacterium]